MKHLNIDLTDDEFKRVEGYKILIIHTELGTIYLKRL